jgi:hypothetical protein
MASTTFASTSSSGLSAPASARVHDSPRNSLSPFGAAVDDFFGARTGPCGATSSSTRTRDNTPAASIAPLPFDQDLESAPPPYASAFDLPSYASLGPEAEPDTLAKHLFKFGFRESPSSRERA